MNPLNTDSMALLIHGQISPRHSNTLPIPLDNTTSATCPLAQGRRLQKLLQRLSARSQYNMPPITRSVTARMRATHLPLEIWLLIISLIPFYDRRAARFALRLLCRMSKVAIEDVCSRYYLPHMRLFSFARIEAQLIASLDFRLMVKWLHFANGGIMHFSIAVDHV